MVDFGNLDGLQNLKRLQPSAMVCYALEVSRRPRPQRPRTHPRHSLRPPLVLAQTGLQDPLPQHQAIHAAQRDDPTLVLFQPGALGIVALEPIKWIPT